MRNLFSLSKTSQKSRHVWTDLVPQYIWRSPGGVEFESALERFLVSVGCFLAQRVIMSPF